MCGKSNDVNIDSATDWKSKMSQNVKDYGPYNIYNCDETDLIFFFYFVNFK